MVQVSKNRLKHIKSIGRCADLYYIICCSFFSSSAQFKCRHDGNCFCSANPFEPGKVFYRYLTQCIQIVVIKCEYAFTQVYRSLVLIARAY
ncbi:hypothetical protein D3C86_1892910 [compost metagenome]